MISREKLLTIITKEKKTKNALKTEYEKVFKTKVHASLISYILEQMVKDEIIKNEKDGWRTYYWK